jgi:hypothetical protein
MQANYIYFYSPLCKYSNEILRMIDANGVRDHFIMIDVSSQKLTVKLPPFVDRVPLVFIRKKNEIVIEQNLPIFIKSLGRESSNSSSSGPSSSSASSLPSEPRPIDMIGQFSYITDSGQGSSIGMGSHFAPLGALGGDPPNAFQNGDLDKENKSGKEPKFNSSDYDQYLAQRDLDVASIFPRQNRA